MNRLSGIARAVENQDLRGSAARTAVDYHEQPQRYQRMKPKAWLTTVHAATLSCCLVVTANLDAAECFSEPPDDEPEEVTKLNRAEHRSLRTLLRKFDGRWLGQIDGFLCKGTFDSPRKEPDNFSLEVEIDVDSSGNLLLEADLENERVTRREQLRIFIDSQRFRVDHNSGKGNALIIYSDDSQIEFLTKNVYEKLDDAIARYMTFRRFEISGSTLNIDFFVFDNGVLASQSRWSLKRR